MPAYMNFRCWNHNVQRSAKRIVHGCEKFVPALAYLFCLALPWSCLASFTNLLADLCMLLVRYQIPITWYMLNLTTCERSSAFTCILQFVWYQAKTTMIYLSSILVMFMCKARDQTPFCTKVKEVQNHRRLRSYGRKRYLPLTFPTFWLLFNWPQVWRPHIALWFIHDVLSTTRCLEEFNAQNNNWPYFPTGNSFFNVVLHVLSI